MTKDDVIRMANEAYCSRVNLHTDQKASISRLERFAKLVAAAEREACAVIAFNAKTYLEAAESIRARRQS
jgi:hypothetical protein